jgi:hypothetical protein
VRYTYLGFAVRLLHLVPKQCLQSSTCAESVYARYIDADVVAPYGVLNYRYYLRNIAFHCLAILWSGLI